MKRKLREVLYAGMYATACVGLVYCCGSCLWRIGGLAGGRLLFGILVLFGGYGAFLCGQTAVEILHGLKRPEALEEEPVEVVVAAAGESGVATAATVLAENASP